MAFNKGKERRWVVEEDARSDVLAVFIVNAAVPPLKSDHERATSRRAQ